MGCRVETITQQQVCSLIIAKYRNRPIGLSTVSKFGNKMRERGHVNTIQNVGRPKASENMKLEC